MTWQSIEQFRTDTPIWIIKYTLYADAHSGEWCSNQANTPDDAVPHVSTHGWYETEAEALAVLRHFPRPNTYEIEKVYQRKLKDVL